MAPQVTIRHDSRNALRLVHAQFFGASRGSDRHVLGPSDEMDLVAHLQRLGEKGRFFRFHNSIQDAQIARYCESIPWSESAVVGWFDDAGVLRGSCQVITAASDRGVGEFGVAVERDFRRLGIAGCLLRQAFDEARRLGIRRLIGHILPENRAMLSLSSRLGFRFNPEIEAYEKMLDGGGEARLAA